MGFKLWPLTWRLCLSVRTPPLGDPALGQAIQYGSPRSGSKRPVERPSSSDRSDWSAMKRSAQQSLVNRPVHSEHSLVTPGPGNTGTGTQYPVTSGIPGTPGQTRRNRSHREHRSHRVHQSHRVHRSDWSTLVRKLKRYRPTSARIGLSYLFLIHRSDRYN